MFKRTTYQHGIVDSNKILYWEVATKMPQAAFKAPHRASALELPQAAIGHHWQDSTHIANNVLTGGVTYGKVRLEASGFYGREPNEARWNIDWGAMNSWSSRLSFFPSKNWTAQVSVGRLQDRESSHAGSICENHGFG